MGKNRRAVERNLGWFLNSGVMRPADGFWGVAERVVILRDNEAARRINNVFPSQTALADGASVLEHRRVDCCVQTAFLFDAAALALDRPELRETAKNLIEYLVRRSCLRHTDASSGKCGLWGWAAPLYKEPVWTDDNSWLIVVFSILSRNGHPELAEPAIAAARTLHRHAAAYMHFLNEHGRDALCPLDARTETDAAEKIIGLRLNPHWMGLVCMAFAHVAELDPGTPYYDVVETYFKTALYGPPKHDERSGRNISAGLSWTLSEYAYLILSGSVVAKRFGCGPAMKAARTAAEILIKSQKPDGHFPAEHYEAPVASHCADLIYTQNWATIGLQHAAGLFDDELGRECRLASERSLAFLAEIQDKSPSLAFNGCWRGMYDTERGIWGGGDCHEGGANSVYTGWTNAPISLSFLSAETGQNLFA